MRGVINQVANMAKARTWLTRNATDFWRQAETTFLASPEYYSRRLEKLESMLARWPGIDRAIDIGCGDGHFTRLFAAKARYVVGYDLSASLISSARESAKRSGIRNVEFRLGDIDEIPDSDRYDLVICMGVSSCILDEGKYARLLDLCCGILEPDGRLLMVDTVRPDFDST